MGLQELFFASILDWDQQNCIRIVDVEEGNVGISPVGRYREASGFVTGDASCDNVYRHDNAMGANVCRLLKGIVHV